MNTIIMWLLAVSAILGGLDKIFGNRFGLGKKFDEGFRLMGLLVSSMVGIVCLTPLLSKALQFSAAPLFRKIGLDPAILGGILPIDMGGFQLAVDLAADPRAGFFAGVFAASTFGCTLIFSIPVGFRMMKEKNRPAFLLGILYGLMLLPVPLLIGGLCSGLDLWMTIRLSLPILLPALLLALGMYLQPDLMVRIFAVLANIIEAVSIIGILAGLTEYLTGFSLLPGILPFQEALLTAALCGIIMVGSLPFAEILGRLLKVPLNRLGTFFHLENNGITAMMLSLVSLSAAFGTIHDADERDVTISAAFLVAAADAFGPHLGIVTTRASGLTAAFIFTKLISGFITVGAAALFLRRKASRKV